MSEPDFSHEAAQDENPYAASEADISRLQETARVVEQVTQLDDPAYNAAREQLGRAYSEMHTLLIFSILILVLEIAFVALMFCLPGFFAMPILLCGASSVGLHIIGLCVFVWYMNRVMEYRDRPQPKTLEHVFSADAQYWRVSGMLILLNLVVTGLMVFTFTV